MLHAHLFLLVLAVISSFAFTESSDGKETIRDRWYLPQIIRSFPTIEHIKEPLLVDGEAGRIYANADVDGLQKIVVLSTADAHYLDSYPYSGRLALDRAHQKLLIDQGHAGIVILDATNGQELGILFLPDSGEPAADPQVDPVRKIGYAFRENASYSIDFENLKVIGTHWSDLRRLVCGEDQGAAPITRSFYDLISDTLYISFNTWECTGFQTDTIKIYDPSSWYLWGEYNTPSQYQAVPFAGNLFGLSYISRLTLHGYWVRSRTQTWYEESVGGNGLALSGNVIDWSRGLLYEAIWQYTIDGESEKTIRISSTMNKELLAIVSYDQPPIQNDRLAGHDPLTDQLYFWDQGRLVSLPTTHVLPVKVIVD